jgi:spectinomycin phosphotransferase
LNDCRCDPHADLAAADTREEEWLLEKPNVPDEELIACVRDDYGIRIAAVAFLPIGADRHTAVYRATANDGTPYFLKLRSGHAFDAMTVTIPRLLRDQGIAEILAPIPTRTGELWAELEDFTLILYPFIAGQDGFTVAVSDRQRIELGSAMKHVHTAAIPDEIRARIPEETYSPHWRDRVRMFQRQAEERVFTEPIAAAVAALLRERRETITEVVERAEALARDLRAGSLPNVICHADLHGGNLLLGEDGALWIVDWDTIIRAPKERDLMFIGGGIDNIWPTAREEELFYRGYGDTAIDRAALAYYRYERVVEDIAAYCEELLLTDAWGAGREVAYGYLASNFAPDGTIARAERADPLR